MRPPLLLLRLSQSQADASSRLLAAFNLGYLQEAPDRCVGAVIGSDLGLGTSWLLGDAFSACSSARSLSPALVRTFD